ncbi:RNA polymerase sigma factor [Flexithrix dorotheae]|uniref:RNA polymerase sigma factor n=1 Tax=Flexithrix dorotheae TaxID=70993 RepID=UPI0003A813F1|nr:sigma-70 family RNA polymerase sigma factor [Flexithrix dorotheae]
MKTTLFNNISGDENSDQLNNNILSDEELWTDLQGGSSIAFHQIYQRYVQVLFNYGKKFTNQRELIEDCMQELFTGLWKYREKLGSVKNLKSYLLISFRRKLIPELQKANRLTEINKKNVRFEIVFSPERTKINEERQLEQNQNLLNQLNSLPERQREALYLRYYEGLSCQEIAEIFEMNPQSVYNLLNRAINLLKKRLLISILILFYIFFHLSE